MEDEQEELVLCLSESMYFRWVCGMKTMCGTRLKKGWLIDKWVHKDPDFSPLPDLEDPATVGCLYYIMRDLYQDPSAYVHKNENGWKVHLTLESISEQRYDTEAEAIGWAIVNYRK